MNGITIVKPANPVKLVAAAMKTLRRDCASDSGPDGGGGGESGDMPIS